MSLCESQALGYQTSASTNTVVQHDTVSVVLHHCHENIWNPNGSLFGSGHTHWLSDALY